MRCSLPLGLLSGTLWLSLVVAPAAAARTNDLARSVSASRQFVAHAPGALLPQTLCVFADQLRREWRSRLSLAEEWRDPIILVVRDRPSGMTIPPAAAAPQLTVFKTELHLKYQISWLRPPALEQGALAEAIVAALCAELANRSQPVTRDEPYIAASIPPWLTVGLTRAVRGRDERLMGLARRSLAGGRPQSAAAILTAPTVPADPLDRDLFEINAALFTEGLLGLPGGPKQLTRFIVALGETKSAPRAFAQVYGEPFVADAALERWWALELTRRTATTVPHALTVAETGRLLAGVLDTHLRTAQTNEALGAQTTIVPFRELWRHDEQPWIEQTIADKERKLDSLLSRVAPGYAPVIEDYRDALAWLSQHKLSRFRRAVRAADARRAAVERRAIAIGDWLDQMEVTHSPLWLDEDFNTFFHALQSFDTLDQNRHSPLSDYLDQFER